MLFPGRWETVIAKATGKSGNNAVQLDNITKGSLRVGLSRGKRLCSQLDMQQFESGFSDCACGPVRSILSFSRLLSGQEPLSMLPFHQFRRLRDICAQLQ